MADGMLMWYETAWSAQRAQDQIFALEDSGFSLANPSTGAVTYIESTGPDIGMQVIATRQGVVRQAALGSAQEFNFQYWLNGETDVFCRIRRAGEDLYVSEFDLTGMTAEEQDHVIGILIRQIHANLDKAAGFVVDRCGGSLETEWDDVVRGEPSPITAMPDLLAIPVRALTGHPDLADFPYQQLDGLATIGETELLIR